MSDKKDIKRIHERMQNLCARSEKCSGEIMQKLYSLGLTEQESTRIIESLKQEKFIDDERFARIFVREKFRINHWGKIKIRFALSSKKVDKDHIDSALDEIDPVEYIEMLEKIIREKNRKIKESNVYKRKAGLFRYASQRGFESELIYDKLDMLLRNEKN